MKYRDVRTAAHATTTQMPPQMTDHASILLVDYSPHRKQQVTITVGTHGDGAQVTKVGDYLATAIMQAEFTQVIPRTEIDVSAWSGTNRRLTRSA